MPVADCLGYSELQRLVALMEEGRMMDLKTCASLVGLVLCLINTAHGQVPEVSLDAPGGVNEGEIANVCLDIVNANLINGTATVTLSTEKNRDDEDFVPFTEVVTILPTSEERPCFNIQTINDNTVENIELFDVILSDENGITVTGGRTRRIGLQDDGDQIEVAFNITTLSVTEGNLLSVCVRVVSGSVGITNGVAVGVTATDITTTSISAGGLLQDYTDFGQTIAVTNRAMPGDVFCETTIITVIADSIVEEKETLSLSLQPSQRVIVSNEVATVTIIDGDAGNVNITSSLSVTEGDSSEAPFQIAIELQGMNIALDRNVTYMVVLADGTASAGSDYRSTTEMITFVPGDSQGATKYVTVQIIGDTVGEPDETFEVSVIPLRPDIDRETIATITIIDNEPKCEPLDDPTDGVVAMTGLYQGATATYSCDVGHELVGVMTRTCDSTAWDNNLPVCAILSCSEPPELVNGRISDSPARVFGSVVTYVCDPDYEFITMDSTRTCQSDQMWSTENIECGLVTPSTTMMPPTTDDGSDDGLSGGAIAGIIIAIVVVVVIVAVLLVLLLVFLWFRSKSRKGSYKPSYDTQDQAPKISKSDIGEPVPADDPETGVAETELTQSNEMLVN